MKSGAVGSWKHSGTGFRCVPQEPWDGGSGAVPESSRWVYLGSVWGLPTAQQGEEWSARVSLEDARVRSRLCSPCTCENTVRVFPRSWRLPRNGAKQGDARVALGTQICSVDLPWRARSPAGPASVSLLARRRGHPPPQAAVQLCLLHNAFLSSLGPLVPGSSGRDIKIASAGKAGALGWPKKFGGWALGAQPHGSRKAAATECQAAAVCKGKLESKRCTQSLK